jgi:hypothetical protein
MKILLKVIGGVAVCVILALVALSITGLDPKERRPGLWLKGDVSSLPADWAFADKNTTLLVETHPWYLIPHAVTVWFVTYKGNLYLHSDFSDGRTYPGGRSWTAGIARDPNVRIKIGNQVFDGKAVVVTDPAEIDALFALTQDKYPKSPVTDSSHRASAYFFRIVHG